MRKNKCHREAVTDGTRGSGGTLTFYFSTTVVFLLLLPFAHSSQSSFCSKPNLTPMVRSSSLLYHTYFRSSVFIYSYGLPAFMRSTNQLHFFDYCMYSRIAMKI